MMKKLLVLWVAVVLVSAVQADYLVNGGFETGDLTGWSLNAGGNHHVVTTEFGILPRSGSYLDTTNWRYDTNTLSQTIVGGPKQGTLTGYIYLTDLTYWPAFMVSDSTNQVNAIIGYESQYIGWNVVAVTRNGWGSIVAGPVVTANTWHEMKFMVDDDGLEFYWDGALVMPKWAPMTAISTIAIGGGWNTVPTGYDDFSFVPEPATLVLLGLGALSAIRKRTA